MCEPDFSKDVIPMQFYSSKIFAFFSSEGVNDSLREARKSEAVCAGILVLVCVVSPIIIALVRNAVNTIQVKCDKLSKSWMTIYSSL